MAAKILFAFAAAVCALAAVSAGPARLFQDAELELQQMDKFDLLDQSAIQNLEDNKFFWINATEVLEKIEESLTRLENKIEAVSDEVQSAVENIVEGIENAAAAAAQKWAEDVAKWVTKANETNTDVQLCLDQQQQPLADAAAALKDDAQQCIAGRINKLNLAMEKVKAVGPAAQKVLEEAKDTIVKCNSLGNIASTTACLMAKVPAVQVDAAVVVAKGTVAVTVAAAQAAAIIPMASLCTSAATAKHAVEVSAIVDTTIACIKEKIAA